MTHDPLASPAGGVLLLWKEGSGRISGLVPSSLFGSLRGCPWHVFAAACHCGVKASLQKRTTDDYDFEICWLHVVEWDINGLSWEILGYDYMII